MPMFFWNLEDLLEQSALTPVTLGWNTLAANGKDYLKKVEQILAKNRKLKNIVRFFVANVKFSDIIDFPEKHKKSIFSLSQKMVSKLLVNVLSFPNNISHPSFFSQTN